MKTQKKSMKKKALLSSLSMLMVATVAVGSATFAWFTQSPTANAQGLQLKASASNGLKIITESHKGSTALSDATFLSKDYLNYDSTTKISSTDSILLNPASYDFSVASGTLNATPYKTTASSDQSAAANGLAAVTEASVGLKDKDVYAEKVYCKLVGVTDAGAEETVRLDSIDVTWEDTANSEVQGAVRILVTYTEDGTEKLIGAYSKAAESGIKSLKGAIAASEDDGATNGYAKLPASSIGSVDFTAVGSIAQTNLGTVETTGKNYVTVYIYIDGEDSQCASKNIKAADLITAVDVQLSIPTT